MTIIPSLLGRASWCAVPLLLCLCALLPRAVDARTLAEAVEAAQTHLPERMIGEERAQWAQAQHRRAQTALAAPVELRLGQRGFGQGAAHGVSETELGLGLFLPRPGQNALLERLADQSRREADESRMWVRWQAAGVVREALWALRREQARLALAEQAVETAKELVAQLARRVRLGEAPVGDETLARSEWLRERALLAEVRAAALAAQAVWLRLTGDAALPADAEEFLSEVPPDAHPARRLARAAIERAVLDLELRRKEGAGAPVLEVGVRNERASTGADWGKSVFVNLSLPLPSPGHEAPRVLPAEQARTEALMALERFEYEQAREQARLDALLAASAEALQLAVEREQLAALQLRREEKSLVLGEVDMDRLLRMRRAWREAALEVAERRVAGFALIAQRNQWMGDVPRSGDRP